jgi:ATP synthase protein I
VNPVQDAAFLCAARPKAGREWSQVNQPLQVTLPDARRMALGVVIGQAAISAASAAIAWVVADMRAGWSALLGGGISTLASLALYALAFRHRAGTDPRDIARGFYLGEATKVGVTIVLMVLALVLWQPSLLAMMAAYIATLMVYWLALAGVKI